MSSDHLRRIKPILFALVGLLIIALLFWVGSQGSVNINTSGKDMHITLQKEGESPVTYSSGSLTRSGVYTIVISGENISHIEEVRVPNFFRTTTINPPQDSPLKSTKLANNTLGISLSRNGVVYSMKSSVFNNALSIHSTSTVFPYNNIVLHQLPREFRPMIVSGGYFLGITESINGDGFRIARLDPQSRRIIDVNGVPELGGEDLSTLDFIVDSVSQSYVVIMEEGVYYSSSLESGLKKMNLSTSKLSYSLSKPLASVAGSTLAIYTGPTYDPEKFDADSQHTDSTPSKKPGSITFFNTRNNGFDSKVISLEKIEGDIGISTFSLSQDLKHIAIAVDGKRLVLTDEMGEPQKTINIDVEQPQLTWLDKKSVAYVDPLLGILKTSVDDLGITSLAQNNLISYSDLRVEEGILYANASSRNIGVFDFGKMLLRFTPEQGVSPASVTPYISKNGYILDSFGNNIYFYAVSSTGPTDPLYEDELGRKKEIDARLKKARQYLKNRGVDSSRNLIIDRNLRSARELINF